MTRLAAAALLAGCATRAASDSRAAPAEACRPRLIDFYADWCEPCVRLDEQTFADPRVRRALARFEVVRVDATEPSAEVDEMAARYRVDGLPTLVFVECGGGVRDDLRVTAFVPPEAMLALLARVR